MITSDGLTSTMSSLAVVVIISRRMVAYCHRNGSHPSSQRAAIQEPGGVSDQPLVSATHYYALKQCCRESIWNM